jgi:hypothetical protein
MSEVELLEVSNFDIIVSFTFCEAKLNPALFSKKTTSRLLGKKLICF